MSRIDELYIKNDDDYMLMSGNNIDCLFLFVHGYGSSPLDLLPLANQINSKGHACALMLLSGHGRDGQDIVGHSYSQWENELLNAIRYYKQTYSNIYLIGFSLGATLCLDVSARGKVSGVIGISTFLDLKSKTAKLVLRACDLLGIKMVPRYLQSTSNKTKSEVDNPKELPTLETKLVLKDARRLLDIKKNIGCDSLLFHSIDDKVSDYSKVRELRLRHSNLKLITLRGLNHLIQFDIPQPAIGDVILEYFFPSNEGTDDQSQLAKDIFSQISVEFNHWSGLLFKLIVGFFTIFGALVYFSLENILLNKSSAPYYLTSYSIVNCLFVVLAAMYFFYINRANVYMKQQIEPYLEMIPWVTYRTNQYLSGRESIFITNRASIVIIGTPLVISLGSLAYLMHRYGHLYVTSPQDNILLASSLFFALILMAISVSSLITLQKYTNRELYYLIPEKLGSLKLINMVHQLYFAIQPGCVKQNFCNVDRSYRDRDGHR